MSIATLGAVLASAAGVSAAAAIDMMAPTANSYPCSQQSESGPTYTPGQCRTENVTWTYYMDSAGTYELEAADRDAVNAAMKQWGDNTDVNQVYDSTPTFSGTAETDVVYQEGFFGGDDTLDGITWCVDVLDSNPNVCDSFYIRIRGNGVYEKWLVAHEAGHALGLTHGREASPVTSNTASILGIMVDGTLPAALGSEPKAQVNATY